MYYIQLLYAGYVQVYQVYTLNKTLNKAFLTSILVTMKAELAVVHSPCEL